MHSLFRNTLVALSLTVALSACAHAPPEPDPKFQAHPQQAYRLQVHTDAAPGPFDTVGAEVLYKVEHPQCLAWKDRFAGIPMQAEHRQTVALNRVNATTYEGVLYADLLVDEDYYGLGVCHWSVNSVNVTLRKGRTAFDAYVFGAIDKGPTSTGVGFLLKDYTAAAAGQGPDYADSTLVATRPFVVPSFTITVDSQAVTSASP
jgi:hypothetical protein